MNIVKRFRVNDGSGFRLKDYDPTETLGIRSKKEAFKTLEEDLQRLANLQDKLYAQNCWAILVILQAMDGAGKDSTIKHVMSGVNPQGCEVYAFKAPSQQELNHDFLWRTACSLPQRGRIGIFNRSYYEEVLVVRVHPELLQNERIPSVLVTKNIWEQRYKDIRAFERYLSRNGILTLKFYLNLSKEEQKNRFLSRLEDPEKNWKFSPTDVVERQCWNEYMEAYEQMIQNTSTDFAPWYVVPADHKWVTRLVVAKVIVETLEGLKPAYPKVDAEKRKALQKARWLLEHKNENGNAKGKKQKPNLD